jgi:phosphoglycerate dehydrogenase-like enzyme
LEELLRISDVVTLHAPSLPSTHHMIGSTELALMKDGAMFVNTSRGALVDEAALISELQSGRISAVLDVTDPEPPSPSSPLLHLPNVFVTPHLAGSQGSELARLSELAIDEIARFARGEPPLYPVLASDLDRIA